MKNQNNTRKHAFSQISGEPVNHSTLENIGDIEPPTKPQISLLMAQLGKKGGKIGGKRRLETMTSEERRAVARKAARARWSAK